MNISDSLVKKVALFISSTLICVSKGRKMCTRPICSHQVDLSHQKGSFNQIYLAKWDSNFVSDNKLCSFLCCSIHCTSQLLIKVNKLFIFCFVSKNVIWQKASFGSRSQMQRLSRWQGVLLQSRTRFQMILSGLNRERKNHRSPVLPLSKQFVDCVQTPSPDDNYITHHLFIASEQCKDQLYCIIRTAKYCLVKFLP